jgi:hypothetical protein
VGAKIAFFRLTILPSVKGRRFLPDSESLRWVPAAGPIRAGLTSQAIRASPALGYSTNLVFQCKELGYRSCKDSMVQCIRSLHLRPEGRGFPRITGKRVDKLVDAYNRHTYPWADGPDEKTSAIHRQRRLQGLVNPVCSPRRRSTRRPQMTSILEMLPSRGPGSGYGLVT